MRVQHTSRASYSFYLWRNKVVIPISASYDGELRNQLELRRCFAPSGKADDFNRDDYENAYLADLEKRSICRAHKFTTDDNFRIPPTHLASLELKSIFGQPVITPST